ncbi:Phospholipid phosphatase like 1.2 like, partial [Pseudolycoriella hygida]
MRCEKTSGERSMLIEETRRSTKEHTKMMEKAYRVFCIIIMIGMLWLIRSFDAPIRGFWCDDQSIRFPHLPMIVDYRILLLICIFLPLTLFRLLPASSENDDTIDMDNRLARIGPTSTGWDFMFGFIMNLVLTTYCKLIIARPRPNFYEICQPTVQCEAFETRFISDFNCTTPPFLARNSLQSFFSGHSSTGTYSGFFMALHLAAHWSVDYNVKALTCSVLIGLGLFPGFSQYLNHWHHWSDVLVGQFVGFLMAAAAFQMRYWLSCIKSSAPVG